jgi:hypothetical protein
MPGLDSDAPVITHALLLRHGSTVSRDEEVIT